MCPDQTSPDSFLFTLNIAILWISRANPLPSLLRIKPAHLKMSSSSSLTTYDLTVPIFVRNLEQLVACLKKGEEWAKDNNKDPQVLVDASIIDDMKVRSNYPNQSLHVPPAHDFFLRLTFTNTAFDLPNSKLLQHFQSSFASHWRRRSSFCRGQ